MMKTVQFTTEEIYEIKLIMEKHIGPFAIQGPNHMAKMLDDVSDKFIEIIDSKEPALTAKCGYKLIWLKEIFDAYMDKYPDIFDELEIGASISNDFKMIVITHNNRCLDIPKDLKYTYCLKNILHKG
ncbi:MAG: hypothetical protein V3U02_12670 [Calditrichia bacterium]